MDGKSLINFFSAFWGFIEPGGGTFKCELPLYLTSNAGTLVKKDRTKQKDRPFIGHIRRASVKVPVNTENAHPFFKDDILMVHNGGLTPNDEKEIPMEYKVKEMVAKTVNGKTEKKEEEVTYKLSDSKIFLDKFAEEYQKREGSNPVTDFEKAFNDAMSKFYGKFAMVFAIGESYYIVRGNTADLFISYLQDSTGKKLGWVINTSDKILDFACSMISGLNLFQGKSELNFTYPKALEKETIYLAEPLDVKAVGKAKENVYVYRKEAGVSNFSRQNFGSNAGSNGAATSGRASDNFLSPEFCADALFDFMYDFSVSVEDLQTIFYILYGASFLELTHEIVEHFFVEVVPVFKASTTRKLRKNMKKNYPLGFHRYLYTENVQYPWFLNEMHVQGDLIKTQKSKAQ